MGNERIAALGAAWTKDEPGRPGAGTGAPIDAAEDIAALAVRLLDAGDDDAADDAAVLASEGRRIAERLGCDAWLRWQVGPDGTVALVGCDGLAPDERERLGSLAALDGCAAAALRSDAAAVACDIATHHASAEQAALAACGLRHVAAVALRPPDGPVQVLAWACRGEPPAPGPARRLLGGIAAVLQAWLARRARERTRLADLARLRDDLRHQALAIDSLPGVVYDWDLTTGHITRMGALLRRLGYDERTSDPTPAWWVERLHPDDRDRAQAAYRAAVADGADRTDLHYRVRRADGAWLWVWERCRLLRDGDGRAVRVLGTTIDVDDQRSAEEALRASTRRLRMVLQASSCVVWEWDPVADRVRRPFSVQPALPETASDEACRLADVVAAVHPADRDAFRAAVDGALARPQGGYHSEHRVVQPDGTVRWLREIATLDRDGDGRVLRMTGLSFDVTETVEATLRLRASEARHAFLLRLGDVLRPLSDPAAIQRAACRALGEHLGAARVGYAEDAGDGVTAFVTTHHAVDVPPFDGRLRYADFGERLVEQFRAGCTVTMHDVAGDDGIDERVRAAYAAGAIGSMIDVPLVKHGRFRAVLFVHQAGPRAWSADEVALVVETAERLWATVERAQAEARLAEERSVLDAVLAAAPAGFALFDADLRFRLINARLAEINGLPVQAHLGRTVDEVLPALAAQAQAMVRQVLATRAPVLDHEIVGETPAAPGVTRQWRESWYPVEGQDGTVREVAVMVEEVTERRRLEREREDLIAALKAADRRKDEFLAMLAHELRNPLAPIRHAVEVLRLPGLEPAQSDRMHDTIARQVTHLSRLVDDLLDASRVTQGKIALDRRPVDLATVAYTGVEQARPLIDARGHHLVLVLPPPGRVWVDADPARLAQVMGNLLANAAKYTDPGGHITLTVETDGDDAVVRVDDDGVGITGEMLPVVFDLFTQADRSLDRAQGGLGIGLALVRSLVTMHGGTVWAQSPGAGRGSRFTVRLPRIAAPQAAQPVAADARPPGGLRVLVVDDNVDAAETLGLLLGLAGCEVRVEHDGATALAASAAFAPAVCLLDIGLPDMDGYQLARRLRAAAGGPGARLVALTGYGRDEDKARAMEAGFDAHLTKPVEPQALFTAIGAPAVSLP